MKTSNKTNRKSLGVAVLMMVLSLVALNLNAQKSFKLNSLAGFPGNLFANVKYEITHAMARQNSDFVLIGTKSNADWTAIPVSYAYDRTEKPSEVPDMDEKEMILEDWMMNTNWDNNSVVEEEMQIEDWMTSPSNWNESAVSSVPENQNFEEKEMILEDWMMSTNWDNTTVVEEEMQIEDWMTNLSSWN